MFLATVVQYNYIIALCLQSCNVIRRFQQVNRVCSCGVLRHNGKLYSGHGLSTDIIGASINAYLNAVNKIVYEEKES